MPNRVVREALIESDRWLNLADNSSRVCFVVCLLKADDAGNMEATPARLRRLWRDYGVDTDDKVSRVLSELTDSDMVRVYEATELYTGRDTEPRKKRFIHIPRFRQFVRYVKRLNPASPWDDHDKIQALAEKKQRESSVSTTPEKRESDALTTLSRPEVEVEVKRITPPTPPSGGVADKSASNPENPSPGRRTSRRSSARATPIGGGAWWRSEPATLAKARELGVKDYPGEDWDQLRARIRVAEASKAKAKTE